MKTVSNTAAILLTLLMIATGSNVFAQGLHENKHPEHYQIKIVREENGLSRSVSEQVLLQEVKRLQTIIVLQAEHIREMGKLY